MSKQFLQELISFMQQKGFVWGPEPEIYGGSAGFYSYGPLGKLLKLNVENTIRKVFTQQEFYEIEFPTIAPKKVWEASGHLSGFTDPMIECDKCSSTYKIEQLLEEIFPDKNIKDPESFYKKQEIKCPNCKKILPKEITKHNLMMKTKVGINGEAYCRPETATTTYLQFQRYYEFFRKKLPFGIFQIGTAYRNEISPRQHLLRTREFTQAEGQLFIFENQKKDYKPYEKIKNETIPFWPWKLRKEDKPIKNTSLEEALKNKWLKNKAYAYFLYLTYKTFIELGFPKERIRLNQHSDEDKAFYAEDAWDIEIKLNSFGWTELCGVHDRTDYDLKQHEKFSGKSMEVLDEESGKKKTPHILEFAYGPSRITFALIDIYYDKKTAEQGKTTLKLPPKIAPIKISVFPLLRKEQLIKQALNIYKELNINWSCKYDETASIGKRYLRSAEEGIPYAVTIDFESLEDNTVTIRDRDTEQQIRVKISDLKEYFSKILD